jgi:hypothetical protein
MVDVDLFQIKGETIIAIEGKKMTQIRSNA